MSYKKYQLRKREARLQKEAVAEKFGIPSYNHKMKTKPEKHEVYIVHKGKLYTPADWGKKPADGVLLFTEHASIVIDAKDMGYMSWDDAQAKVKKAGKTLPDRHEAIEITSRRDEINKALRQIGGEEIDG